MRVARVRVEGRVGAADLGCQAPASLRPPPPAKRPLPPARPQTTKAHITVLGGIVEELVADAGLIVTSTNPFKGDMDVAKLTECIERNTPQRIAFVRVEAGTNLIGGQPFSLQNLKDVRQVGGGLCGGRGVRRRVCVLGWGAHNTQQQDRAAAPAATFPQPIKAAHPAAAPACGTPAPLPNQSKQPTHHHPPAPRCVTSTACC